MTNLGMPVSVKIEQEMAGNGEFWPDLDLFNNAPPIRAIATPLKYVLLFILKNQGGFRSPKNH